MISSPAVERSGLTPEAVLANNTAMMRIFEVFWRFLLLGCTSFGGPAAHVGYFRALFVERLNWLDDGTFSRLFALSQFLPGPGSSQMGFAIGCHRAGTPGGLAAFAGFTLPSFLMMLALAVSLGGDASNSMPPAVHGILHGLKLLAVVVVADATLGMFRSFCKCRLTAGLCVATAGALLIRPGMFSQFGALIVAALVGMVLLRAKSSDAVDLNTSQGKPRVHWVPLILFALLFAGSPWLMRMQGAPNLFAGFYQAGSLVFGGGHVVLPLLQSHSVASGLTQESFLVGYAAAQGVPGPMFTLATFLGAGLSPGQAIQGATLATLGIFLPGFLLLLGFKDAWQSLTSAPRLNGAVSGLNAAVVGLLIAACYQPVFTSSVASPTDFAIVVAGFYLLRSLKLPVLALVLTFAGIGTLVPPHPLIPYPAPMTPSITELHYIDSHTGGEPTRVVHSGFPELAGDTMAEKRVSLQNSHDWVRSASVNEPRGSDAVVGAVLLPPSDPAMDAGVIFFNNVGYINMCVHGTIGLAVTLAHMGRLAANGTARIETPVGNVEATLTDSNFVTVANVPSFRSQADVTVEVPSYGVVTGDVAWGGNWFFLVEQDSIKLCLANVGELTRFSTAIRRALAEANVTGDDGMEIDHIELFSPPASGLDADSQNFVLCPGGAYDRSPCGTGTSAKLACLHARGKLGPGQIWRQASIVGSIFEGTVETQGATVIPRIKGSAYITGEGRALIDPRDPFAHGVRC